MTRGPRRLKDDPDFQWETGCDVADEGMVVGGYDHDASRTRLLAAIALLPPVTVGDGVPAVRSGPSAWRAAARPVVGAVAGAMVIATAYWLGVQAGSDPVIDASSPVIEQVEPARDVEIEVLPEPVAPTVPGTATELVPVVEVRPAVVQRRTVAGESDPAPAVALVAPEIASDGLGAGGTPEGEDAGAKAIEPTAATLERDSLLPLEIEVVQRADEALAGGRYKAAQKGYEGYLLDFPEGRLIVEAQFGLLQAMHADGDTAGAESLAARIQDLPPFASRREDIVRLRAESLVHLDRCSDALLLTEGLSSRLATEIRRACRQHRE